MATRTSTLRPAGLSGIERRRGFLVEVAWLYHEYGLTQDEIAARFGTSRSTISRALSEAEALGIVQVTLTEPMPLQARLAQGLRERYSVTAHVGIRIGEQAGRVAAARVAARLIERVAALGHVKLAASWGRTLAAAAREVRPRQTSAVLVIDAVGHASGTQLAPAIDVTSTLASSLGAAAVHIPSPAFVDSEVTRQALLDSPPVEQALALARAADVTFVSVGVVGESSLLRQEGLISAEAMHKLVQAGAVGEILGRYYDAAGATVEGPVVEPIGLSLDDLRLSRRVIAVAAGADKAQAVRGALAGEIISEIVVDDELAQALLELPFAPTLR